ncbi:hypothetical protein BST61_g8711 [Cercospora zeina]
MSDSIGAKPPALPEDYQPIFKRLKSAWDSSIYSDFKITCNGLEWEVHRVIVCQASQFFASCCKNFKEASTGAVDLPDDNKSAVDAMLTYMYTADYSDKGKFFSVSFFEPILFNVHVHTIGDKYGMPDLCKLAEAKFAELAAKCWRTAGFAKAVEEMYTTAPDSKRNLQKTAVEIVVKHSEALFKDDKSNFAEITRKVAPFAYAVSSELLAAKDRKKDNELRYQCPGCQRTFIREKFASSSGYNKQSSAGCPWTCGQYSVGAFKVVESK